MDPAQIVPLIAVSVMVMSGLLLIFQNSGTSGISLPEFGFKINLPSTPTGLVISLYSSSLNPNTVDFFKKQLSPVLAIENIDKLVTFEVIPYGATK